MSLNQNGNINTTSMDMKERLDFCIKSTQYYTELMNDITNNYSEQEKENLLKELTTINLIRFDENTKSNGNVWTNSDNNKLQMNVRIDQMQNNNNTLQEESKNILDNIIQPSVVIGQALEESGVNLNSASLFGIKASAGEAYVTAQTWEEYAPGTSTTINANFAAYDSLADAVQGYYKFIDNGSKTNTYAKALNNNDSYNTIQQIKAGGYATDSEYVSKVWNGYINRYNLTEYDKF